jgi:hypothetical protein
MLESANVLASAIVNPGVRLIMVTCPFRRNEYRRHACQQLFERAEKSVVYDAR